MAQEGVCHLPINLRFRAHPRDSDRLVRMLDAAALLEKREKGERGDLHPALFCVFPIIQSRAQDDGWVDWRQEFEVTCIYVVVCDLKIAKDVPCEKKDYLNDLRTYCLCAHL